MARRNEFTVVASFKYSVSDEGTLSAGTMWDSSKELEADQVAEIETVEIFAPVGDDGTYQDLKRVVPVIDGKDLDYIINLPGKYDLLFTPPWNGVVKWRFTFGRAGERHPLRNTTLKAAESIGIKAYAGASDVTKDFLIRFWGRLYEEEETLTDVFGERLYGEGFEIRVVEEIRGKTLTFTKPEVEVNIDNFDKLVGGVNQDSPKIMPFATFATNAKATSPNELYEFKRTNDYVANDWENMFWDLERKREAIVLQRMGVRSVAHLEGFGVRIGAELYPRDLYPADPDTNKWHFGLADVQGYSTANWFGIPVLELGGFLIHDEKGRIVVRDDGTSISAGSIYVACAGIKITELPRGGGR